MGSYTNITKYNEEDSKLFVKINDLLIALNEPLLTDNEVIYIKNILCNVPDGLSELCQSYYFLIIILSLRHPRCNFDLKVKLQHMLNCTECSFDLDSMFNKFRKKETYIVFTGVDESKGC